MGCTISVHVEFDPMNDTEKGMLEEFLALGLTKHHVDKLYTLFVSMDKDNSQNISRAELLKYLQIEHTPFMKYAFNVFDMDGSGELDFLEFVCSTWNFLSNDERTMGSFIYLVCPKDDVSRKSKKCRFEDVAEVLRSIYVKVEGRDNAQLAVNSAIKALHSALGNEIGPAALESYIYENQFVVQPAIKSQHKMRELILGLGEWESIIKKRKKSQHLRDFDYPLILRDRIEKLQKKIARDKKERQGKEIAKSGNLGRKQSILISLLKLDYKTNKKKQEEDNQRHDAAAAAAGMSRNDRSIESNNENFLASKGRAKIAEKKNEEFYSIKQSTKRPASPGKRAGAPISKVLGDGDLAFAIKKN